MPMMARTPISYVPRPEVSSEWRLAKRVIGLECYFRDAV